MERLQAHQDKLSQWLSADSGHILDECGDILTVNELKKITVQPKEEQMRLLLELILSKGAAACEAFMDILRRNQGRNRQLQQFFTSSSDDWGVPCILADENSVVTCRTFRNVNTESLACNVETVISPRGNPSGPSASEARVKATGGSVVVADRLDGVTAGDINYSVNMNPSLQVGATFSVYNQTFKGPEPIPPSRAPPEPDPHPALLGGAAAPPAAQTLRLALWGTCDVFASVLHPDHKFRAPAAGTADDLCQQAAVRTVREKKVKLMESLMADADFVLQHVHQRSIVSHREYQNLRSSCGPQETVTRLLDLVLSKGPGKCGDFLQLLRDPDVLDTFPPLRDILDMTGQS